MKFGGGWLGGETEATVVGGAVKRRSERENSGSRGGEKPCRYTQNFFVSLAKYLKGWIWRVW